MGAVNDLLARLNRFDAATRSAALTQLVQGEIERPAQIAAVNLHCHTFFSYNAYGHSPSSLAWLAREQGWTAAGIVDFDVLDAVDEFLAACDLVGVRGSAGLETRVFIPQFAAREINSPGEPGIYYHMGIGFTSSRVPPAAAATLVAMRERIDRRNRVMLARLNAHLAPVAVDYERDVLPLTPAGSVTERHMLLAITGAVHAHFVTDDARDSSLRSAALRMTQPAPDAVRNTEIAFWAEKLSLPAGQIAATIGDTVAFSNLVRGRLMKKGGAGYVQPSPDAYSTIEEFHDFIWMCGALPCATWLDGLSAGEQAIHELLELLIGKGVVALNIVPDRNWNIADPELRRVKVAKLHEIVRIAAEYDLPLNIGTEMNAPGNKLVDDFDVPEMAPLREAFLAGAYFVCGHTVMQRALGLGYQSDWAQAHLPARRARNAFYTAVGRRVVSPAQLAPLKGLPPDAIWDYFCSNEAMVAMSPTSPTRPVGLHEHTFVSAEQRRTIAAAHESRREHDS